MAFDRGATEGRLERRYCHCGKRMEPVEVEGRRPVEMFICGDCGYRRFGGFLKRRARR